MDGKSRRKKRQRYVRRVPKYRYERNLIKGLERRLHDYAPESGTDPGAAPPPKEEGAFIGARLFSQLPLSHPTQRGLEEAGYTEMTDIQRSALPHGLVGRDVLGAAKTGSGKTLVFLITILEKLYRGQWSRMDGLGAIIISPVRELALQIFEELRKVGKHHDFSAGLLIGGKDVDVEKGRIGVMNILIGTPGRLLHHLDETVGFDVTPLQLLVLDEADRLLDMGFARMLDAIVGHLPKERQSMLFSATQTKSVKDLVRLSLSDPEYLAVHAEAQTATPAKLKQFYVMCGLHEKLTVLWSFIKTHPRSKIIVFVSTCTQVRFLYEALKKLLSHQHVCCLHGRIKQNKRTETFFQFCQSKAMVLLATDVAARGLDFPEVDWVLQLDCADTVAEYIHRVGRTARYTADGQALLLLMPQESHFLPKLLEKHIPIKQMKLKKSALTCPTVALQSLLTKAPPMKTCAKKAMVTYMKSYLLNSNHQLEGLNVEAFAVSLGLMALPSSRALKKIMRRIQGKPPPHAKEKSLVEEKEGGEVDTELFTSAEGPPKDLAHEQTNTLQQPSLLKAMTESWDRGAEGSELEADAFHDAQERFESLRQTLQQRTAEDREFVKSWKKEAAQRSQEREAEEHLSRHVTAQLATSEGEESSELEEISCSDDGEVEERQDYPSKKTKYTPTERMDEY